MMKYGAFTQVAIAIIAVVIVVTYVRPTFLAIGDIQDKIAEFDQAIEQVNTVNNQLASLVSQVNNIPVADRRALLTFMPDQIDEVAVLRDIKTMVEVAGAEVSDVSYGTYDLPEGTSRDTEERLTEPVSYTFEVSLIGSYEDVKRAIRNLEENDYPLHAYNLEIGTAQADLGGQEDEVEASLLLRTYSRQQPVEPLEFSGN